MCALPTEGYLQFALVLGVASTSELEFTVGDQTVTFKKSSRGAKWESGPSAECSISYRRPPTPAESVWNFLEGLEPIMDILHLFFG